MVSAIDDHLYVTNDQADGNGRKKTALCQQKERFQLSISLGLAL